MLSRDRNPMEESLLLAYPTSPEAVIFPPSPQFPRDVHESYRIGWNPSWTASDSCRFRTSLQWDSNAQSSFQWIRGCRLTTLCCLESERKEKGGISNVVLQIVVVGRRPERGIEANSWRSKRQKGLCNAEELKWYRPVKVRSGRLLLLLLLLSSSTSMSMSMRKKKLKLVQKATKGKR